MTSLQRILPCLALLLPLSVACFEDEHTVGADDAGGGIDGGTTSDAGRTECTSSNSCASGAKCFWEIGSCSSKGECIVFPAPGTAVCNAIEELCGCDGTMVTTGCDAPSGYATGPTTGAHSCSEDAGTPPVECVTDSSCAAGSHCYYPIGSCSAKGQCIVWPVPGEVVCNSIEEVCGCDGSAVFTGCAEPSGYATGPTTGGPGQSCSGDGGAGCTGENPGCCGLNMQGCNAIIAEATCTSGAWTCPSGDSVGPVCDTICGGIDASAP